MTTRAQIIITVPLSGHPLLQDCLRNVRDTEGVDPMVWISPDNVSVARNDAMAAADSEYVCFLDADAFPQGRGWLDHLVEVADANRATMVSCVEILDFPGERIVPRSAAASDPRQVYSGEATTMCLLARRQDCLGGFDPYMGLLSETIGGCLEDTDLARNLRSKDARHWWTPKVQVLHKDRGTATYKDWTCTDEFLAYELMATLLDVKWHPINTERRADFFRGLRRVPSRDQRTMADGYGPKDLLNAFLPVTDTLRPEDRQPVTGALETVLERFVQRRAK